MHVCVCMRVCVCVCGCFQQPANVTYLKEQPTFAGKAPQLSYLVSKLMGCLHQLEQVSGCWLCPHVLTSGHTPCSSYFSSAPSQLRLSWECHSVEN